MGLFGVKITIANPLDPSRQVEVELLVDIGATLSWVPRELAERIGAPHVSRIPVRLADGRSVERETSGAIFKYDGATSVAPFVVAEPGDSSLLGATALEALGFAVDPVNKRLVPQALLAM
ncbi:MAG: aspartyl protease family protein [Candidatus Acidiferrales bacterium]